MVWEGNGAKKDVFHHFLFEGFPFLMYVCMLLLWAGNGKDLTDAASLGKELGGKFFTPFTGKRNSPSSLVIYEVVDN